MRTPSFYTSIRGYAHGVFGFAPCRGRMAWLRSRSYAWRGQRVRMYRQRDVTKTGGEGWRTDLGLTDVAATSIPRRFGLLATGLVAASLSLIAAALDETPRIPGAVTTCPTWLKKGAPFDVGAFFSMPAEEQNAAPLYLDAFAEFSAAVADCLPASQKGRAEAARDRSKRLDARNGDLGDEAGLGRSRGGRRAPGRS